MRLRRTCLGTAVALAVVLGIPACSSAGAATGVVTGRAWACSGPYRGPGSLLATLQVYRGHALIATKTIPSGTRYRFTLSPGRYVVSNTGNRKGQPSVSVHSSQVSRVNIPDICK